MEAYSAGPSHTTTVLTFLSAWTSELHALGYLSGVYSSTASGIHDLVAADTDPSDTMPDELWIANWNGQQSTADSAVPSSEWANHQRLHQYQGAHNETWGKVKLNVDSDYVDGATVGTGSVTPTSTAPTAPTLRISPQPNGTIALTGSWSGQSGIAAWRPFGATSATSIVPLANPAPKAGVVSHSAFPYFAEQAIGADGQVLGTTPLTPTPPHLVIYGRSVFVPATGLAGVPVGCFVSSPCHVQLTVTRGRTVLAQTNPERVGAERSGIVYFAMTGAGRAALAAAQGRLPVTLSLRDGTQARTGGELTLVSFATSGRGPARAATQSSVVSLVGLTDFVRGGVGGILAGCSGVAPCHASVTLIAGGATIATTGTEFMGANELTYLAFRLTPHGRALLAAAPGNQLGVRAIVSTGVAAATGNIALVGY
jgi:hypothetical protein